jgi:hypothetical protein
MPPMVDARVTPFGSAVNGEADERSMLALFRRLHGQDRVLAVELMRTLVNVIRAGG